MNRVHTRFRPKNPGAFVIDTLFANNEQGAWYDPSDLNTLFQDDAGTIPVTASGQTVGRMLDKSGNGHHATQATAASRPTFRDVDGLRYLEFDGTNDAMITGSVDLSATDSVTVFAGLRKISDAAVGIFLEFTANSSTTNGSFAILAPHAAANSTIGFRSRGTVLSQATPAGISAPTTRVITMLSDISADSIVARVNGAVAATSVTDQGTGNYANSQINIGRRADTSSPFIGHLYGVIVRGASTDAANTSGTERYLAAKSGVTLA